MRELVSIVLPIYNVENYLEKSVDAVLNQTYDNLEVILVDDGAKDNSGKICDELSQKDSRIKVVHKQNGGLASARNAGYEVANGKYLMYIDSDDTIKNEVVERCVSAIERDESDLVIYGYDKVDEQGKLLETCVWRDKIFSNEEMVDYLFYVIQEMSFGYAWNKLYRKSIIDASGVLADAKIIDREDLVYNMELLKYIKKISYIDYVGYEYLQRGTSLLHNSNLARLKGIEYFVERMKNIDVGKEQINRKVFNMNVLHYMSDCIVKNVIWNKELKGNEKRKIMGDVIAGCPYTENLYDDLENRKHLRILYKSIATEKMMYFYIYVRLGDFKRKLLRV